MCDCVCVCVVWCDDDRCSINIKQLYQYFKLKLCFSPLPHPLVPIHHSIFHSISYSRSSSTSSSLHWNISWKTIKSFGFRFINHDVDNTYCDYCGTLSLISCSACPPPHRHHHHYFTDPLTDTDINQSSISPEGVFRFRLCQPGRQACDTLCGSLSVLQLRFEKDHECSQVWWCRLCCGAKPGGGQQQPYGNLFCLWGLNCIVLFGVATH